ncbi:MAG: hypothetical protein H6830_05225 [Planctomycetes bacterium]|nr:hypothetical protein [Planctomycetota bacterium]MCB9913294.1 hypothetical protein [Planctomycetota bacterium]
MADSQANPDRGRPDDVSRLAPQVPSTEPSSEPTNGAAPGGNEDRKWAQLRSLLVGPETERIEQLENHPPKPEHLATVLADAVQRSTSANGELAEALRPSIEKGLLTSARKNPEELAEAIYPVLGPAIRRSIRAALAASLQSLNVALENSISPQGIRWRLEAWRTGKPFSEVVLLHSLEYRVEQVYWIHKQTGVLLNGASANVDGQRDPDLVSGMLAAIQDFVQDSFQGAGGGELEQIEISGFRVLLAQGAKSGLAALVRGIPPQQLSEDMSATLESLQRRLGNELDTFDGEVTPFEVAHRELEGLLGGQAKARGKRGMGPWLLGAALAGILLWWGGSKVSSERLESSREQALAALQKEPGYWIQGDAEHSVWTGLRDPLARPLDQVLGDLEGQVKVDWSWQAFQSIDPAIVLKRAHAVLEPPASVTLKLVDQRLLVGGLASGAWSKRAAAMAPGIAGIQSIDWSALVDQDRQAIEMRSRSLDGLYLPFGNRSGALDQARPEVRARLDAIRALDAMVLAYGGVLRIELASVLGQDESYDRGLAEKRLQEVQSALAKLGLACTILDVQPAPKESAAVGSKPGVRLGVRALLPQAP